MSAAASRAQWLEERSTYLGGTDVAAILGLHKYKSPLEVFLQKTGQLPPKDSNIRMRMGVALEELGAEIYSEVTGLQLEPGRLLRHPEYPFLASNPDRLVVGEARGLEVKTCDFNTWHEWGPGNDEEKLGVISDKVPNHVWFQSHHYEWLWGFPFWDVIVLNRSNADCKIYTLEYNDTASKLALPRLIEFWENIENFRAGRKYKEPEPTGLECDIEYLTGKCPTDNGESVRSDHEVDQIAATLRGIRGELKPLETDKKDIESRLKSFMGDASKLVTMEGDFTWKKTKDKTETDYEMVMDGVQRAMSKGLTVTPEDLQTLIQLHTTTKEGSRRFCAPYDWRTD